MSNFEEKKICVSILILFIPLFILLSSFDLAIFKMNYFEYHIVNNGIEAETGKSSGEILDIYKDLLDYLKGENIDLSQNFNSREVSHMEDVRGLFKCGFFIKNTLFVFSLLIVLYIFLKDREHIYYYLDRLFKGIIGWWLVLVGIFTLFIFDFSRFFLYFHLIFFDNDLWIMDPTTDLMIQMLPSVFFLDSFKRIVLVFILLFTVFSILVYLGRKRRKIC